MQRITYLDGAKGICAFFVFLAHFAMSFKYVSSICADYLNRTHFQFLASKTAVYLFIIISIYICLNLLKSKSAQDIILKRYFRLAIPVSVTLIFLCLLKLLGYLYNHQMPPGNDWLIKDTMPYNTLVYAILESPLGRTNGWLNVVWMLIYIFEGTLLAVILKIAMKDVKPYKQVLILLFLSLLFLHYDYIWINFTFAYILFIYKEIYENKKIDAYLLFFAIVSLVFLDFYPREVIPNQLRAFCLSICIFCSQKIQRFLSCRVLKFLGYISFEIYLLQLPIIYSLSSFLWLKTINIWLILVITFLLIIVFAAFTTIYVEKPILKQSDKIINWIKS